MKIEKIMPLQGKYLAQYVIKELPDSGAKVLVYKRIEFMGFIDNEWKALIVANDGSFEVASQVNGFREIITVSE